MTYAIRSSFALAEMVAHLHSFPIRSTQRHRPQTIMHLLQQLAARFTLFSSAFFIHLDVGRIDTDWLSKLNDCARTEFVRMKVRQTDRDELDVEAGCSGYSAKSHD